MHLLTIYTYNRNLHYDVLYNANIIIYYMHVYTEMDIPILL